MSRSLFPVAPIFVAGCLAALLTACGSPEDPKTVLAAAQANLVAGNASTAAVELKTLLSRAELSPAESAQLRSLLGQALLESGDPAGAEIELKRALEMAHPEEQVLPHLARALLAQQKHAQLVSLLGKRQLKDPTADAELKTALATAHRNQGQFKAAGEALALALERAPEHVPALLLQASLAAAEGKDKQASEIIDAVIRRDPANVQAWTIRGQMQAAQGDADAAGQSLGQALKLKPDSVSAHTALIVLALSGNDVPQAEKRLQAMQQALPSNPQTRFHEAKVAFAKGDAKRARELTLPLLRSGDQNLGLLQLAGAVELKLKAPVRAESLLGKAVALAPSAPVPRLMLAQALMANAQAAKALQVLRPLLEGDAPMQPALLLAARAALVQGDARSADALFARAAQLYPDSGELAQARAVSRARKSLTDSSLEELASVVDTTSDRTSQLILVSARLARGQVKEARALLADLTAKAPNDPFPLELAGRVALKQGDLPLATQHFKAALALEPTHYPAIAGLAGIDLAAGKTAQALERLEALLKQEPDHLLALMAMAEIHERSPEGQAEAVRLLERAAQAHPENRGPTELLVEHWMKRQKFEAAATAARQGLNARQDDPGLLSLLGKAQVAAGQTQQAVSTYTRLASLQPKSPDPWLSVADIHLNQGRLPAAIDAAAKARQIAPQSLPVLRMVAGLAVRAKRFDQALAAAKDVQNAQPDDAAGYLIEGEVKLLDGEEVAAERVLRLAMDKRDASEAAKRLHALLVSKGRTDEAAKLAAQWQARHPKDMDFPLHLAMRMIERKEHAGAEAVLRKVHQQQPRNVDVLNNIAWLMTQQRKPGAVKYAERAIVFSPDNPVLLDTLAMAYASEKRFDDAIRTQKRTLQLMPDSGAFALNLARIHHMAGDKTQAVAVLQTLTGKSFAGQAEAVKMLAALRGS